LLTDPSSDILHPGRANISKEELREKLGSLYKAVKDQISVFGLRTQFGGGKTTGFALVYDSPEAMKKFEPNYRLVRVGLATKAERAGRQQRASLSLPTTTLVCLSSLPKLTPPRQAAQEPPEDAAGYGKGQGRQEEEGVSVSPPARSEGGKDRYPRPGCLDAIDDDDGQGGCGREGQGRDVVLLPRRPPDSAASTAAAALRRPGRTGVRIEVAGRKWAFLSPSSAGERLGSCFVCALRTALASLASIGTSIFFPRCPQ
jgi:ribosomal protein S24E